MLTKLYQRIVAVAVALMCVAIFAMTLSLWKQRRDTIADATLAAGNIATILAEQTSHSAQAIDIVLMEIVERARNASASGEAQFRSDMGSLAAHEFLKERLARLSQADLLGVADKNGDMLARTRDWPAPAVNVADRDYFIHQTTGPQRDLFISEPVKNRITGTTTVFFARRLESAAGEFLGVVWVGVRPEFFLRIKDAISSIPGESFVLARRDGVVFFRHPDSENRAGSKFPQGSAWYDLVTEGQGVYQSPGVFDGTTRWVAVRALDAFPLVVNVAVKEDVLLRGWRERTRLIVGGALIAIIGFGLLMHQFFRQFRQAIEADATLRDREARLFHLAHYDALTGLGNRTMFQERFAESFALQTGESADFSILLIDVDQFKGVNDSYGHDVGDAVLRDVAAIIGRSASRDDLVARLGGDEFAILRVGGGDPAVLGERLLSAFESPLRVRCRSTRIGVSIGVATSSADAASLGDVLKNADLALYRAKADGRGCLRLFQPEMRKETLTQLELANELREAIRGGDLELWYQPILDAATGDVRAMEALARWRHPSKGMIPPSLFVALAEKFGFVCMLDNFVVDRACRDAARWPAHVAVAVNISAIHLGHGTLVPVVRDALAKWDFPASRLEIEMTETAIMSNSDNCRSTLRELRALGIRVALDDFGTGYSSLCHLQNFRFDKIKIDKSFVDNVLSGDSSAIIAAVTSIAKSLDAKTVAEGVESRDQLALLKAAGVDEVQGYHLGRPAPAGSWRFANGTVGPARDLALAT